MSGREASDGTQPSRSQLAQSQGSNAGAAGRGPGGRGQGSAPNPAHGGVAPLETGGASHGRGDGAPVAPVTFSKAVNMTRGDAPAIMFGSAIGQDGGVNTAPSPQQPERPTGERPSTGGRTGGQGGRGSNKGPNAGRRQANSAAPRVNVNDIRFGSGFPIDQMPTNPGHMVPNPIGYPSPYPPSGYGQQFHPGYQQQMYQGYPGHHGGYPQQYMQQSPPSNAYGRQQRGGPSQGGMYPPQRGGAYPGRSHGDVPRSAPPANGKSGGQSAKPAAVPQSVPRRGPLKLQDPKTKEDIKLGDFKAKPSEPEQASAQKQPSVGGPTSKPEQAPVNGSATPAITVPPKRVLSIAPPPSGGPSKASPAKDKRISPPPPPPSPPRKDVVSDTGKEAEDSKQAAQAAEEAKREADAEAKRKADADAAAKAEEAAQKAAKEAAEKAAAEKAAAEKRAAEAKEAAEKEKARKEAEEKAAAQKAEAERKAAAEREAAEKAEAEKKAKAEREAKEAAEKEAAQKAEAERKAADRAAAEKAKAKEEEEAKAAKKREEEEAAKKAAAEATKASEKEDEPVGDEEGAPASSEASASASTQPKKGKKALQDAIRRKNEEAKADTREADMSAYKSPAQRAAAAAAPPAAAPSTAPPPAPVAAPPKAAAPEAAEEDNWEDKEEFTPRGAGAAAAHNSEQGGKKGRLFYSFDYMRNLNDKVVQKENGRMWITWPGMDLIGDALRNEVMKSGHSRGRGGGYQGAPPGSTGGPMSRPGPRDMPVREEANWNRGRPLQPPGPPGGFNGPPGAMPGPGMGGRGGGGRGGPHGGFPMENDRWLRSQPLPPVPQAPKLPQLHKTANRFERGKMISENPVEEAKQKNIKSLLNKITPEKYTVIRDKLLASGIDSPLSLYGLIDQVFDKALTEPTFCEIYATLCSDLNKSLPQFPPPPETEDTKNITFRRSLVNKCQEEFMTGSEAMAAVKQREVADAEKGEEGITEAAELEEGEISQEDKLAKRRKELLDAQNERKGRMRALGNIQFVGQLYKQAMLTEKIMHECIKTLLEDIETPRTEDVECLCKLMSTVGSQLENSTKFGKKEHMNVYFDRMEKMSQLPKLESRLKFMIRDVVDLRKNRWQERRKTEGPKTIEEIHRDARMEQQMAARPPPDTRGGPRNMGGPRFNAHPPMGARPPIHLKRHEDRLEEKPRPMTRTPSQEGPLAPGGGFRPGGSLGSRGSSPAPRDAAAPSSTGAAAAGPAESDAAGKAEAKPEASTSQSAAGPQGGASKEASEKLAATLLNDFVSTRDTKELEQAVQKDLLGAGLSGAVALATWFTNSFEKKEITQDISREFLLFVVKSKLLPGEEIKAGLGSVLEDLSDTAVDVPFAPKLVGEVAGALVAEGGLRLEDLSKLVLAAGQGNVEEGEDTDLVDSGAAAKVVASALKAYAAAAGQEKALQAWKASSLEWKSFFPSYEEDVKKALEKEGVAEYA